MGTSETVTTPDNGGVIERTETTVTPQPHSDSDTSGSTIPAPGTPAPGSSERSDVNFPDGGDTVVPARSGDGSAAKNGVA